MMDDAFSRYVRGRLAREMFGEPVADRPEARYLDPAILRLGPPAPPRRTHTIHVSQPALHDFTPGERVETSSTSMDPRLRMLTVSTRWVTVVSWDRATGELVVTPDAERQDVMRRA